VVSSESFLSGSWFASFDLCITKYVIYFLCSDRRFRESMTQRSKTLVYWDQVHEENHQSSAIEWIADPSSTILEKLASYLPSESPLRLLEVGCGTSCLSKSLYQHITIHPCNVDEFCVTDVSPVCIQHNQTRDAEFIRHHHPRFRYKIWNILDNIDGSSSKNDKPFDVILDKGCLDTFLFRSETRIQSVLVAKFLRFLHSWCTKKYIVITPRSKLPTLLRDHPGFLSIQKNILTERIGVLVGSNKGKPKNERAYVHVCIIDPNYTCPSLMVMNYSNDTASNEVVKLTCDKCGISSNEFFGQLNSCLSQAKKIRQWKGHQTHCRASKNREEKE